MTMVKQHFKSIEEAMPILRPGDKIDKILNNKVAIVRSLFTNGKYDKPDVMYLHNGTIYTFWELHNLDKSISYYLKLPNIERSTWCCDHSQNGKPYHYLSKIVDNRRLKKTARQIHKAFYS